MTETHKDTYERHDTILPYSREHSGIRLAYTPESQPKSLLQTRVCLLDYEAVGEPIKTCCSTTYWLHISLSRLGKAITSLRYAIARDLDITPSYILDSQDELAHLETISRVWRLRVPKVNNQDHTLPALIFSNFSSLTIWDELYEYISLMSSRAETLSKETKHEVTCEHHTLLIHMHEFLVAWQRRVGHPETRKPTIQPISMVAQHEGKQEQSDEAAPTIIPDKPFGGLGPELYHALHMLRQHSLAS